MTFWFILFGIITLLAMLAMIPLTVEITWNSEGHSVIFHLGFVRLRSKRRQAGREKRSKKKPNWPFLQIILKNGYHILCRLLAEGRIDALRLHFTSAFSDPAVTAMAYGMVGTAMDTLMQFARIDEPDLRADIDFDATAPVFDLYLRVSRRVYRLASMAGLFGGGFLRDYLRLKRERAGNDRASNR